MSNLVTYKIKYTCSDSLLDVIKQYNSVLRFTYNRLSENKNLKTSEITQMQKLLNNCGLIGSYLRCSAICDAKSLLSDSDRDIVFGGRKLFNDRCNHKIDKEQFRLKRLRPLSCVGEACRCGNRLFQIVNEKTIIFKLNRDCHFELNLSSISKKRLLSIKKLIQLQNNCQIPITYKLDLEYIYIIFDYNAIKTYSYKVKENRVIAIDMNPNSIGWSVVDWKSESNYDVIQSGTFSLKPLNDYRDSKNVSSESDLHRYVTNKRKHEIIHIAKDLFNLCKHYKCEIFAIEDLSIESRDSDKGRKFNRLVNNMWNRNLLFQQIKKHVAASSTTFVEIQPQYNSYIGNLIFRKECLPDECLASIEIGRRGFEFSTQYIFNRQQRKKTVIFPELELVKNQLIQSLEELNIDVSDFDNWGSILSAVKGSKVKYRFSTSDAQKCHAEGLFSKFYKQKYLYVYIYIYDCLLNLYFGDSVKSYIEKY